MSGCEVTRGLHHAVALATFPFPGRSARCSRTPYGHAETLGALATIGTPPVVIALNQKLKGDDVSIAYAFLPKEGIIAIFGSDARGHMGKEPIGLVGLTAGDHYNVNVALSPLPKSGTKLWAVLERAGGTQPFTKLDGELAEQTFKML